MAQRAVKLKFGTADPTNPDIPTLAMAFFAKNKEGQLEKAQMAMYR